MQKNSFHFKFFFFLHNNAKLFVVVLLLINLNASLLNKSFVFLFTDPKLLNSSAFKTILDENFGYIYYMRL